MKSIGPRKSYENDSFKSLPLIPAKLILNRGITRYTYRSTAVLISVRAVLLFIDEGIDYNVNESQKC
jgi:hypothetical protein